MSKLMSSIMLSIILLCVVGCGKLNPPKSTLVVQKNNSHLCIISTEPQSPAILELGQKLLINLEYNLGDSNSVSIWARPQTNGLKTKGYRAHPSPAYHRNDTPKGATQGWFYFDNPTTVDEVIVKMKDNESGEYVSIATLPVQLEWR